jgi:hypothetical protein
MDPRARPGSIGWVGTTAGITEDGRFIELVDLKSEATRRKSSRPEQQQWWAETARLFSGEAIFKDSSDVTIKLTATPMTPACGRPSRQLHRRASGS